MQNITFDNNAIFIKNVHHEYVYQNTHPTVDDASRMFVHSHRGCLLLLDTCSFGDCVAHIIMIIWSIIVWQISLNEDYSQRVITRRKELLPQMKEARERGKVAYLSFDKLVVKDKLVG